MLHGVRQINMPSEMDFRAFNGRLLFPLVEGGAAQRRSPGQLALTVSFSLVILVSASLTLCLRISHTATPSGALEPPGSSLVQEDEKGEQSFLAVEVHKTPPPRTPGAHYQSK